MEWTPKQIRELRNKWGLTQTGLATLLRLRQSAISRWESGNKKPGGPATLLLDLLDRDDPVVAILEELAIDSIPQV